MKINVRNICKSFVIIVCSILISSSVSAKNSKGDFYQIKIYNLKNNEQVIAVDQYLKNAFLPALHRAGILKVGVFKPITNDTAQIKRVYVFIPFHSVREWENLDNVLNKDKVYKAASKSFTDAAYNNVPYERLESILLDAFPMHKHFEVPSLKNPNSEKIYELRSYESPTERLHEIKVKMFNDGDEVGLFKRLGFNAVFYANVISGSHMPNLMYMISFENMAEHDAHWKAFGNDPQWKKISSMPEYENKYSVSHIDAVLMHATDYSDI